MLTRSVTVNNPRSITQITVYPIFCNCPSQIFNHAAVLLRRRTEIPEEFSEHRPFLPFPGTYARCFLHAQIQRKGGKSTENISRTKKKKKSAKPLRKELELYREKGILLCLNGEPSTPKIIAKACQIADCGVYMRDYTEDQNGRIACVNFNFVED
ncbi:MAG: hypothetical protein LUF78_03050 [Clostridiales bacterium]|nr:hypothetical protein [Clostridiales bacterium]